MVMWLYFIRMYYNTEKLSFSCVFLTMNFMKVTRGIMIDPQISALT